MNQKYLRWLILRNLPRCLLAAGLLLAVASYIILSKQDRYAASAKLLVRLNAPASELSEANRQNAEAARAQVIAERLLSRPGLERVSAELGLGDYARLDQAAKTRIQSGRGRATLLTIEVTASDPEFATRAAQVLSTTAMADLEADRRSALQNSFDFYRTEVAALEAKLRLQTDQLAGFKSANADALPEKLQHYLDQQAVIEQLLRRSRETQVSASETAAARMLVDLRENYAQASALYSEDHPVLRVLAAKISAVEARQDPTPPDPPDQSALQQELSDLRMVIAKIPQNAALLQRLERDIDLTETLYRSAMEAYAIASQREKDAGQLFGETLTLIEPAEDASLVSPRRKAILLVLAAFGALAMSAGAIWLIQRNDQVIRCAARVERRVGITPFANLPILAQPTPA